VLELALLCGFDAATLAVAPALLAGWRGEGWRRAIEVFIFVVLGVVGRSVVHFYEVHVARLKPAC
jgi:hypothetical protein